MDMLDNKSTQINLSHEGRYSFGKIESRVYHQHVKHYMDFGDDKMYWYKIGVAETNPNTPGATPGMPMYTESDLFGISSTLTRELSDKQILKTGVDLQQYKLDDWWPPVSGSMMMGPGTFSNINNGQRDRYGVFAELQSQHSPTLKSILGARYELVKTNAGDVRGYSPSASSTLANATTFNTSDRNQTDNNLDLSGLLKFEPNQVESYDLGLSRKNRSPNLYERYTWSTWSMASIMNNYAGDGNGYVGNPNLKPETAYTLSTAANWNDASKEIWGVRLNPYYTYVDNYVDVNCITNCSSSTQFKILQYTNQRAELYGVDLSGYRSLGKADLAHVESMSFFQKNLIV
jgi:iron complex outermembrane receptor protein